MTDRADPLDLTGKVALITGGGAGIGAGIAHRFHDAGASVVVSYRNRKPEPPAVPGDRWLAVSADVTHQGAADRLVTITTTRHERLDMLVNNAAAQDLAPLADMTDDQFTAMLHTNLVAVHQLTQRAAPELAEAGGGSIVHIASIEGSTPAPNHAHYAISKAAVIMHAKAAALEYGPLGVRVNTISPGLIDRPGLADDWPEGVERWHRAAPLGRLGTPGDVADACLFLCSGLATWITGTDLTLDGGVSTHPHW